MTKKFMVGVKEVHIQYYEVEADTAEDAQKFVQKFADTGEGDNVSFSSFEYSHSVTDEDGLLEMYVNEVKDGAYC